MTTAPRAAQNIAVATPVRAIPTTRTRLFFSSTGPGMTYLNFSVVNANNANTSAAIQKRTITFDSLQPINSKW